MGKGFLPGKWACRNKTDSHPEATHSSQGFFEKGAGVSVSAAGAVICLSSCGSRLSALRPAAAVMEAYSTCVLGLCFPGEGRRGLSRIEGTDRKRGQEGRRSPQAFQNHCGVRPHRGAMSRL